MKASILALVGTLLLSDVHARPSKPNNASTSLVVVARDKVPSFDSGNEVYSWQVTSDSNEIEDQYNNEDTAELGAEAIWEFTSIDNHDLASCTTTITCEHGGTLSATFTLSQAGDSFGRYQYQTLVDFANSVAIPLNVENRPDVLAADLYALSVNEQIGTLEVFYEG